MSQFQASINPNSRVKDSETRENSGFESRVQNRGPRNKRLQVNVSDSCTAKQPACLKHLDSSTCSKQNITDTTLPQYLVLQYHESKTHAQNTVIFQVTSQKASRSEKDSHTLPLGEAATVQIMSPNDSRSYSDHRSSHKSEALFFIRFVMMHDAAKRGEETSCMLQHIRAAQCGPGISFILTCSESWLDNRFDFFSFDDNTLRAE